MSQRARRSALVGGYAAAANKVFFNSMRSVPVR
jgi:hypothetical protein